MLDFGFLEKIFFYFACFGASKMRHLFEYDGISMADASSYKFIQVHTRLYKTINICKSNEE